MLHYCLINPCYILKDCSGGICPFEKIALPTVCGNPWAECYVKKKNSTGKNSNEIRDNGLLYVKSNVIFLFFQVLEIPIVYEILDGLDSPEVEYPPHPPDRDSRNQPIGTCGPSGSVGSYGSSTSDGKVRPKIKQPPKNVILFL